MSKKKSGQDEKRQITALTLETIRLVLEAIRTLIVFWFF